MLQDGLAKVVSGETTFEEILKLIDLEDDLGTNTNLGLEETIKDSEINNKARDYEILDLQSFSFALKKIGIKPIT